jgi:hypothetical protein
MTQTSWPADPLPTQDLRVEDRGRPDSLAPQRHPILIGISGERIFDNTNVEADCAIADALADRFRTLFEALEKDLPETPKIVLTGAAFGTDLIAAEMALQIGSNWSVAAVLPFDRVLFEEDFPAITGRKARAAMAQSIRKACPHLRACPGFTGQTKSPSHRTRTA